MKPYRLKHIPTGLYYQPHKHGGSHLSKTGKIYQTKVNIVDKLTIYCQFGSRVYEMTKDRLNWSEPHGSYYGQVKCKTLITDWMTEEIT